MWAWGTAGGVGWTLLVVLVGHCWWCWLDTAGGVGCCTGIANLSHGLILAAIEVKPFIWLVTNIKVDIFMDWEGNQKVVVGMTGETAHVG